ncbi:MAG: hypothetical protein Q8R90_03120 [Bacteroidales bacterium]|nr:hypothetical protein [Bacteroidales bacterium]
MIIAISLGFIVVLLELRLFNLIAFLGPAFILIQKFSTIYLIDTDTMTLSVNLVKKNGDWSEATDPLPGGGGGGGRT